MNFNNFPCESSPRSTIKMFSKARRNQKIMYLHVWYQRSAGSGDESIPRGGIILFLLVKLDDTEDVSTFPHHMACINGRHYTGLCSTPPPFTTFLGQIRENRKSP